MQSSDPLENPIREGEPMLPAQPREHLGASANPLRGWQVSEKQIRFVTGTLTLTLFVLACCSPVVRDWYGIAFLLYGWIGIGYGIIAWYANLLFLPALLLFFFGYYRESRWLGLAGTLIALTSLLVPTTSLISLSGMAYHPTPSPDFGNEIPGYGIVFVTGYEVGFYLWLGSFFLLSFASWWLASLMTSAKIREVSLTITRWRHVHMPRMVVAGRKSIPLGAVLGTLAGCVPAAAAYVVAQGHGNGQFGLWIVILLIINAPLGTVAGLIGGIMYGAKQRFPTAASPCLGIVAGGIISVISEVTLRMSPRYLLWLAPVVGGVLGVFFAIWTWRQVVPPISPPRAQNDRRGEVEEKGS